MLTLSSYQSRRRVLGSATLRNFSGGLNTKDDDKVLPYRYATAAKNVWFDRDGTVHVRWGVRQFATLPEPVVDMFYYNRALVAATAPGKVWVVDASASPTLVWDGWSATQFASFVPANGDLFIHNGVDKPLHMQSDFSVAYSLDPVTASNTNTPVGKYAIAAGRYHVVAGVEEFPNRVYISMRDGPRTWFGDPEPNDATYVDVGFNLAQASEIRGLLWFRNRLLVLFPEGVVVGALGIYNEDNEHVPDFTESIEGFGCVAHRTAIARGDEGFFLDYTGVNSLARTVLSELFKPEQMSEDIASDVTAAISGLTDEELENNAFAVMDSKEGQYILFLPNGRVFCLTYNARRKLQAWSEYAGWSFTCGCRTITGDIYFGDAQGKLWQLGNRDNPIYLDGAEPIEFEWELPWLDFGKRGETKTVKYIGLDTKGEAEFAVELYVDSIRSNWAARLEFSGGEQGGFGSGPQPYGGGRNTSYEKMWAFTAKCKLAKLRFSGVADAKLSFSSITLHYMQGGIKR